MSKRPHCFAFAIYEELAGAQVLFRREVTQAVEFPTALPGSQQLPQSHGGLALPTGELLLLGLVEA